MRHANDAIELREIAHALRREARWLIAGAAVGLLLGTALMILLPPRYQSMATVLLRASPQSGMSGLAGLGEGSVAALAMGGSPGILSLDNGFDTEVEILSSRSVVGAVVDSLRLQVQVVRPRGWSTDSLFTAIDTPHDIPAARYRFRREGTRYRASGTGVSVMVVPGRAARIGGITLVLHSTRLPDEFVVRVSDYSDAVQATRRRLTVEKAAGSVAAVSYRASDPATAAAVPNAVLAQYLARRRTTDRGVNQQRYEFLREHTDSIAEELSRAALALRIHQQQSGVLSPKVQNEAEVVQAMKLRSQAQELEVEARALERVMADGARGSLDARAIASYPTLLSNPAVNHLLAMLSESESRRTALLDRRTAEDPDVLLLDREIQEVEAQIIGIARSFHAGVSHQLAELRVELQGSRALLAALPVEVETSFRLEREAERLAHTLTALQTQLVQARLAAITEGGDVRPVDVAESPKHAAFPTPPFLVALGLMGGLFFGGIGAVARGVFGASVGDIYQAERVAGVPAVGYSSDALLLIGGLGEVRCVLVIPVLPGASSVDVARRIAVTAALRGGDVVLAELDSVPAAGLLPAADPELAVASTAVVAVSEGLESDSERGGSERGGSERGGYRVFRGAEMGEGRVRVVLEELEERHSLVVAALPTLEHPATAAVLSAQRPAVLVVGAGRTRRVELEGAVNALQRLSVTILSVVVQNGRRKL